MKYVVQNIPKCQFVPPFIYTTHSFVSHIHPYLEDSGLDNYNNNNDKNERVVNNIRMLLFYNSTICTLCYSKYLFIVNI